jgi:hypothetical protein
LIAAAKELGFEVLLQSTKYLDEVAAFVEDKCVIWCGSDWASFGKTVPNFMGESQERQ